MDTIGSQNTIQSGAIKGPLTLRLSLGWPSYGAALVLRRSQGLGWLVHALSASCRGTASPLTSSSPHNRDCPPFSLPHTQHGGRR